MVALFLLSRLALVAAGKLTSLVLAKGSSPHSPHLTEMFLRWDSGWYLTIAQKGYPSVPLSPNFFPMLPWLIRATSAVTGLSPVCAGYLIANTATLVACILLWRLTWNCFGERRLAYAAAGLFLFNPVSFFYATVYTESLFVVFALGAFLCLGSRYWPVALACGVGAGMTRSVGFLLCAPLAAQWLGLQTRRPYLAWPRRPWAALAVAGPLVGLAAYCTYLHFAVGDAFAFKTAAAMEWKRSVVFPWVTLAAEVRRLADNTFYGIWFLGSALAFLAVAGYGLIRTTLPAHLHVFLWCYFAFYLCSSLLEAVPRYLSILFPLYMILAVAIKNSQLLNGVILFLFGALWMLSIALFVNGYWFT